MRLLCVQPGASFSTSDVYDGMVGALKRAGHDVQEYRLDARVEESRQYITWRERAKKRIDPSYEPPAGGIMPMVVRHASMTLLEAALTVNPHWIVIFSGQFLHPDALRLLYRMGARTCLILTESPYDDGKQAALTPYATVVTTNERGSVALLERTYQQTKHDPFNTRGAEKVHYLPHAYDPEKHHPSNGDADIDVPKHDVVFVGSGFIERQETLAAVDWDGLKLDFGLYGVWPYMGSRSKLRRYWRAGTVDNAMTAALYRNAKIGLNLYRQSVGTSRNATRIVGAQSLNPRALELAATGTPHLSDWRPEVEEVFGRLVPTFKDPHDLQEMMRFLCSNSFADHRDEMRARLPKAVEGWTFDARARQLVGILAEHQP
jgi:hypothetical protein